MKLELVLDIIAEIVRDVIIVAVVLGLLGLYVYAWWCGLHGEPGAWAFVVPVSILVLWVWAIERVG